MVIACSSTPVPAPVRILIGRHRVRLHGVGVGSVCVQLPTPGTYRSDSLGLDMRSGYRASFWLLLTFDGVLVGAVIIGRGAHVVVSFSVSGSCQLQRLIEKCLVF